MAYIGGMNGIFERRADRRRKDRKSLKTFELGRLNQRHHEVLNLAVLGISNEMIGQAVGLNPAHVSRIVTSELGQQKMALLRGARDMDTVDVAKRIQNLVPKALDIYEKILSEELTPGSSPHGGANIALQKATADTIMKDFSGHAVPKKVLVGHAKVTPELLNELKEAGKAAARECGLIEGTAEVVSEG
jgi:hypothetical protein